MKREARLKPFPKRFSGGKWEYEYHPFVKLGEVGRWAMIRRAEYPNARPTVISLKAWDELPVKDEDNG